MFLERKKIWFCQLSDKFNKQMVEVRTRRSVDYLEPTNGADFEMSATRYLPKGKPALAIDVENLAGTAVLTFAEEFDSFHPWNGHTGWDAKWSYDPIEGGAGYNKELQWYVNDGYAPTDAIKPWKAQGGVLTITATRAASDVKPHIRNMEYTSGMINSYHWFSQQYGYFEMRAQLPASRGLWSAFWLLRKDQTMSSEIDIVEQIGQEPNARYSSVHSFATGSIQTQSGMRFVLDAPADFHTYGLHWSATKLEFYMDGLKYWETQTPPDMHAPMFVIVSLAVGGTWPGNPDRTTQFPAEMKIDYIRVYRETHN